MYGLEGIQPDAALAQLLFHLVHVHKKTAEIVDKKPHVQAFLCFRHQNVLYLLPPLTVIYNEIFQKDAFLCGLKILKERIFHFIPYTEIGNGGILINRKTVPGQEAGQLYLIGIDAAELLYFFLIIRQAVFCFFLAFTQLFVNGKIFSFAAPEKIQDKPKARQSQQYHYPELPVMIGVAYQRKYQQRRKDFNKEVELPCVLPHHSGQHYDKNNLQYQYAQHAPCSEKPVGLGPALVKTFSFRYAHIQTSAASNTGPSVQILVLLT